MLTSRTVTVGTTAVDLLDGIDTDRELEVFLRTRLTTGEVLVGDSSVVMGNGFRLNEYNGITPLHLTLHGDTIYAVADGTGNKIDVLVVGVK